MKYCTCKEPMAEEVERGVIYCLNCELEIETEGQDEPEPDFDEKTQEEDDFYNEAALNRSYNV